MTHIWRTDRIADNCDGDPSREYRLSKIMRGTRRSPRSGMKCAPGDAEQDLIAMAERFDVAAQPGAYLAGSTVLRADREAAASGRELWDVDSARKVGSQGWLARLLARLARAPR